MTRAHRVLCPGDVSLRVSEAGHGQPVLLLHGFTGSAASLAGLSEPIGAIRRAITPDLVGHGESDAPTDPAAYSMPACVDQVIAVLDALACDSVDVVGYSMGGRVALSLAARAPGRCRSLALVGATAGLREAADREARVRADEALARRIETEGLEAFVDHWMALPLFASQRRLGAQALAAQRAARLGCRVAGLTGSLRGMGTGSMPPLHDALPKMEMPVLLIVGAEDEKFRAIAEEMSDTLPDARVAYVDEAGHAAHLEQPERVLALLEDFWSGAGR